MSKRIVIVGGGVMGSSSAWLLARSGCDVVVLEKAVPGAEASSAAAGILGAQIECSGPGPMLDLCLRSRQMWPSFAAQLREASGIDPGFLPCGAADVAFTESQLDHLRDGARWMAAAGLRASLVDGDELCAHEPAIGPAAIGGLVVPDDHQVDPPLLVRAVASAAARAGARFVPHQAVESVNYVDSRAVSVTTATRTWAADEVVIATGAWTSRVPGLAATRARITPQHGQLAMLDTRPPVLRRVVVSGRTYVVPRADGRVVIGATSEDTGFAKKVTASGLTALLAEAIRMVPALGAATFVDAWSGLRPRSSDDLPMIGPHGSIAGLHLAAGHHRNGILLAPVTAHIVAASVLGEDIGFDTSPFVP